MSSWLDKSIEDLELRQSIKDLLTEHPSSTNVIQRLIEYYESKDDRMAKRRKLDQNDLIKDQLVRLIDVSFQSPARKKYDIIITPTHLILYNSKTETIEFNYRLNDFALGTCVPTPEKTNKAFTYALFLKNEDAVVFNTQDKVAIKIEVVNKEASVLESDKHEIIAQLLTEHARIAISQPSKQAFVCSAGNKTAEDKYYVTAYLKAKDGFLFFLPTGILYGFKKPTLFIPLSSISENAVTSITQRTFDLVLTLKKESHVYGSPGFRATKEGEDESIQFSMISQEEYGPIDAYIKKAGIDDQSMSEERKAVSKKESDSSEVKEEGMEGNQHDSEDSENDENFNPSDSDEEDPLEYDTDAEEEEEEEKVPLNEPRDEMDEEQDMLDESD
ncbi:hypothetical protein RMATCC62417_08216 [Rhizopus microsporus]|nr:hypothetical protein RMATCC62417_08216 [Rhizopus microsporus]